MQKFDFDALFNLGLSAFRKHRDPVEMADRFANLCWIRWRRLEDEGKLTEENWEVTKVYTIRAVWKGRRPEGYTVRDAMDEASRIAKGFEVESSGDSWSFLDETADPAELALAKDSLEQYLKTLKPRDQEILTRMVAGWSTPELATEFKISPARVSQMRRQHWTALKD